MSLNNKTPTNFTFAIITDWSDKIRVDEVVDTIRHRAGMREYEILIIGGNGPYIERRVALHQIIKEIPAANEWITTKKNTAAWLAKYSNIVMMHDYFLLDQYWFDGWDEFCENHDWDIASNPQIMMNGKRHFTDWVLWDHPEIPRYTSIDYWNWSLNNYQYISGGYFLVKRKVMMENPFDSALKPGSPEDVEWSFRVRHKYKMRCNPYSVVKHNKIHRDCYYGT
jgi:hypothetical protein